MSESTDRDRGLLSLIERLVKRPEPAAPRTAPDGPTAPDEGRAEGLDPVVPESKPATSLEPQLSVETLRKVDAGKLADLVLRALQAGEGCPAKGFEVTVYGVRPWNAMLRITPAAGAVDAAAWRKRLQTVVQLFREQYELDDAA